MKNANILVALHISLIPHMQSMPPNPPVPFPQCHFAMVWELAMQVAQKWYAQKILAMVVIFVLAHTKRVHDQGNSKIKISRDVT